MINLFRSSMAQKNKSKKLSPPIVVVLALAVILLAVGPTLGAGVEPVAEVPKTLVDKKTVKKSPENNNKPSNPVSDDANQLTQKPTLAASPSVADTAKRWNKFGWNLYGKVRAEQRDSNLVFSPFSVADALTLVGAGAAGTTADELQGLFVCPTQTKENSKECPVLRLEDVGALRRQLASGENTAPAVEILTANAVWAPAGTVREDFQERAKQQGGAEARTLDFAQPERGAHTINAWVAQQTRNRIPQVVDAATLADAALLVTSTLYFKGEWLHPFNPKSTLRDVDFYRDPQTVVKIALMNQPGEFAWKNGKTVSTLAIPYKEKRFELVVFLPNPDQSLADLDLDECVSLLEDLRTTEPQPVRVLLPKFHIAATVKLEKPLRALGVKKVFQNDADFSGMIISGPLKLGSVFHRAVVEVDELGTTAAAATVIKTLRSSVSRMVFRVDRPFFLVLRERSSGVILLMGQILDPSVAVRH